MDMDMDMDMDNNVEALKKAAAHKAVTQVQKNMVLALGTGSTQSDWSRDHLSESYSVDSELQRCRK